jgi:rhodanese-related sulfurtransferase
MEPHAPASHDGGRTMRKLLVLACGVLAVILAPGCTTRTSARSLVFVDPVDAEQLLVPRKGALGLGREKHVAWIDPRPEHRFAEGHIDGAISLPFPRVAEGHGALRVYDILIVYGDDYNDPLAEAMSKRLIELKHADVRTLRGGLRAWQGAGHEVAK